MELAEVVNANFAVPVVGVVLCAVLVFAFGFKSSVQPPSFDFEEEEKRFRKRKGKKSQTNGHIPNTVSNSVAKQGSPPLAKQAASKTQAPKQEEALPQVKSKAKKTAQSPKNAPAKLDKTKDKVEDDDGWTTAISKKVKKRRNKEQQDEPSKYDPQDMDMSSGEAKVEELQEVITAPTVEAEVDVVVESPKGQRKRKDKNRKPVKDALKSDGCELVDGHGDDTAKKDSVPKQPMEEKMTEDVPPEIIPEVDTQRKPSPKRSKLKKDKTAPAPEKALEMAVSDDPPEEHGAGRDQQVEMEKTVESVSERGVGSSKNDNDQDLKSSLTDAKKAKKSPKKKKKGTPLDVPGATQEPSGVKEESNHISSENHANSDASSKLSQTVQETVTEGAAKENIPLENTSEATPSEETSKPQQPSSHSSSPVTFDELGEDWIEAKPQKKKKKARREN